MTPHWRQTEWADGIGAFAARLRRGTTTARAATERSLARIAEHDGQMQAFVHVAADAALEQADRADALLADGTDLGPLMGVPVGIKDLFAVEGMPTRAGSRLDISHAIGAEGPFVARLRAAGAVILGKCRTIEFAAGAQNISHPTPWNPADPATHRSPGGSSNGSATAVAAGYCPLAIGSDTGGSVRAPAALCGLVGHKFTAGNISLDGIFPLCRTLDSIGTLTVHPSDAFLVYDTLFAPEGAARPEMPLSGCRLGIPHADMLGELAPDVAAAFDDVMERLRSAGAELTLLDWPTSDDLDAVAAVFANLVPAELANTLGAALVAGEADKIDPVAMHRLGPGRDMMHLDMQSLHDDLSRMAKRTQERMKGISALIYPTSPITAPRVEDVMTPTAAVEFNGRVLRITRMVNAYGLTACSVPLARPPGALPIGVDIAMPAGEDRRCLVFANAVSEARSA